MNGALAPKSSTWSDSGHFCSLSMGQSKSCGHSEPQREQGRMVHSVLGGWEVGLFGTAHKTTKAT